MPDEHHGYTHPTVAAGVATVGGGGLIGGVVGAILGGRGALGLKNGALVGYVLGVASGGVLWQNPSLVTGDWTGGGQNPMISRE